MADEKQLGAAETRLVTDVPEAELNLTFSGPAFHSNKFYGMNFPAGMRIAFMEALGPQFPIQFRTAVLLSFQDAMQLRDLLNQQLRDIEPALKDAAEKAAAAAKAPGDAE